MVKTHPMWNHFPDIQNFLLECLELIIEKTTIDNHDIKKSVTDLIDSRGKLLRPAYFYLFSRFGDASLDQHKKMVAAAASTEVLHLATLIHDDIIDEADQLNCHSHSPYPNFFHWILVKYLNFINNE